MHYNTGCCQDNAHADGIDDHCPKIKLQLFLCPRTNTGNSDTDQLDNFAGSDAVEYFETSKQFQQKCRHSVIRANRQVHHQFDDKKNVYAATKSPVKLLLFLRLFYRHGYERLMKSENRPNQSRSRLEG